MPRLFAIEDGEAIEPTVVMGCAPFARKEVQNAGQAFFDKFEKTDISEDGEQDGSKAGKQESSGGDEGDSPSKGPKKKKEKKEREQGLKLADCLKGEDLYALLEVDVSAGTEELKKAYRKICIVHHPDKHADKSPEEMVKVNEYFVMLQEAYAVLNDLKKRRKYDSLGDFDDRVPTKLKDGEDFYEAFASVFKRNGKWSENKPVPELGDADTPYEKVQKFYEFWFNFESWRDLDEAIIEENGDDCFQDVEEAESRDERRWMEKENARIRGKYMKAERQRLFGFVELAEKLDPRVRAEKDKQFAEAEAKKAAKEAKRTEAGEKAREEVALKEKEEERKRIVQAAEKAKRQEELQVKKAARAKLRKVVKDLNLGLAEDPLQEFLLALDYTETDKLTEELQGGAKGEAVFAAMKGKGVEPVILSMAAEDDKSTTEGGTSEDEKPSEEDVARMKKEQLKRQKDQERKKKSDDAKMEVIRAEEALVRAEEKKVRDAQKKVDQEKKDREQQKAHKKRAEQAKREEEKRIRDEEQIVEKAKKEKEANTKRAEERKLKAKQSNEAENTVKALETRTVEFERDRLERCEAFDIAAALTGAMMEAAQAAMENPVVASGLAAAADLEYEDPEDLLDNQLACLGTFFALGMCPAEDALALSSGLRSRVKKIRARITKAASAGEFALEAPAGTTADPVALEALVLFALNQGPSPLVAPDAAAAISPPKSKKKAKAAPQEEDLDALLLEFGMTAEKKGKKSGKKK